MVVRKGWWRGGKEKEDWLQSDEGGNLSTRILVNCYQGRSRTKRTLHKAPTKQFLLYLKKAAESLVDDKVNKHDFEGCNVAEIVQRWLHVLCGSDFTQREVDRMLANYHTKAIKLRDEKLEPYLNEGLLVSPTARTARADCSVAGQDRQDRHLS